MAESHPKNAPPPPGGFPGAKPAPSSPPADSKRGPAHDEEAEQFAFSPTLDSVLEALSQRGLYQGDRLGDQFLIRCPWAGEHPAGASSRATYDYFGKKTQFGEFRCACEHAEPRGTMDFMEHLGILDQLRISERRSAPIKSRGEAAPSTPADQSSEKKTAPSPSNTRQQPATAESEASGGNRAERRKMAALARHSLRGKATEIEASAAESKPLFGRFALSGQATMIYAAPNTGKTLLMMRCCLDAIAAGLIDPDKLFYFNADDSLAGLAVKVRLLQDEGAHMLAPGQQGLRATDLVSLLTQMVEEGSANGSCVIIDTLKKVSDLMDKKRSSEFNDVCRQFVMAGGTIVALGHTTKTPSKDGTPRYQGTTDVLDDFDAVYVAEPLVSKGGGEQLIKLTRRKRRGNNPEVAAYAYTAGSGVSYEEMLASIHSVEPDGLDAYRSVKEEVSDPPLMAAFVSLIESGCEDGKMGLARRVATECGVSHRAAMEVLERYTGNTRNVHLWNYRNAGHGKRIYYLIDQSNGEA